MPGRASPIGLTRLARSDTRTLPPPARPHPRQPNHRPDALSTNEGMAPAPPLGDDAVSQTYPTATHHSHARHPPAPQPRPRAAPPPRGRQQAAETPSAPPRCPASAAPHAPRARSSQAPARAHTNHHQARPGRPRRHTHEHTSKQPRARSNEQRRDPLTSTRTPPRARPYTTTVSPEGEDTPGANIYRPLRVLGALVLSGFENRSDLLVTLRVATSRSRRRL